MGDLKFKKNRRREGVSKKKLSRRKREKTTRKTGSDKNLQSPEKKLVAARSTGFFCSKGVFGVFRKRCQRGMKGVVTSSPRQIGKERKKQKNTEEEEKRSSQAGLGM